MRCFHLKLKKILKVRLALKLINKMEESWLIVKASTVLSKQASVVIGCKFHISQVMLWDDVGVTVPKCAVNKSVTWGCLDGKSRVLLFSLLDSMYLEHRAEYLISTQICSGAVLRLLPGEIVLWFVIHVKRREASYNS